jgi:hypothetical protein
MQISLAITLSISIAITAFLFIQSYRLNIQLSETERRIDTGNNVTRYVESLGNNIKDIERLTESLSPIPAHTVKYDMELIDLIEEGTDSSEFDIDHVYIATLRNYHRRLQSNNSQFLVSNMQDAAFSAGISVDDSLYQIFAGAQRSIASLHSEKHHILNLSNSVASLISIFMTISLLELFLLISVSVSIAVRSHRSYASISTNSL